MEQYGVTVHLFLNTEQLKAFVGTINDTGKNVLILTE